VNSWSTAHGGSSTSLIDVVTNLDPARYRPIVMCPTEGDLPARLRDAHIPVVIRGINRPTREEMHRFVVEVPRHAVWLRSHHIALVHGNTSASRRSIVQAASCAGVPYIQHVRNTIHKTPSAYGYRVARQIICNSDATAATFRAHPSFAAKTVSLHNAVDLSQYTGANDTRREELSLGPLRPVIGFVGQIVPRKGVTTLIAAMATVVSHVPDALLVIVGCAPPDETDYETECRRLVTTFGLDQHVRFVGYRRDVAPFMRTFDVFALPTRSEPFGKVVVEAMAAGCPVVATHVGGIPEIVTRPEVGTLIQPDDPAALSSALLTYLTDPDRRRQVGKDAADEARMRFGMTAMLGRLQALYDSVLNRGADLNAPVRRRREEGTA
jgi:glycosyltransferase involved in cell wall biosynthesis